MIIFLYSKELFKDNREGQGMESLLAGDWFDILKALLVLAASFFGLFPCRG
jgi:hypothetical protein